METRELQDKILALLVQWDKKRDTVSDQNSVFVHLVEEVGELAAEYVNRESRKDRYSEKALENAIGDIFMQLVWLAHLHGLDLERVVEKIIREEEEILKQ